MATEVIMPQLGESVVEGTVGKWLISEGEEIKEYEPLLEVVTDKVDTEIPAPAGGLLLKILVPEGTTVAAGTVLAFIGEPGEAIPAPAAHAELEVEAAVVSEPPEREGPGQVKPGGRGVITPVVARIAAEHGIDLASLDIPGSGRSGRITKKDILAYIQGGRERTSAQEALPPWEQPGSGELFKPTEEVKPTAPAVAEGTKGELPRIVTSAPAPGEVLPLTPMRKAIADHMLRSVRTSPHVTTVMEADMSRVAAYREGWQAEFQRREGLKLTFTPFFMQAVIEGLKSVPEANSSFTEEGIVLQRRINIGVAVALETGLIVPVVKDADGLSLSGLQRTVTDLAERARGKQLKTDEVQGGTFTLTNHGVAGSLFATPIISQPQAGILGVGAIKKRPVVVTVEGADSIAIKPMCYLSFSFDHRIMDGALADRFLATVVKVLENWSG